MIVSTAMNEFWFKPKIFGYGATPTTWQGWTFVTLYFAVLGVATGVLIGRDSPVSAWIVWAAIVIVVTVVASWIMRRKTDGPWRWRWGRTNSRNAS